MAIYPNLVYEYYSLDDNLCHFDSIRLDEYDNSLIDSGYTYSGLTLTLNLTDFTPHFDTSGHTYSNIILNNDVYSYTGITGETHFFTIQDFYLGAIPYIDPLLSGETESTVVTGFTTSITGCTDLFSGLTGTCCPTESVLSNLPWVYQIDHGTGIGNCEPFIQRRPVSGWTIDYVFNREDLPWEDVVFFYTGVRDEYNPDYYLDNNMSFSFTSDGRIRFQSMRYSGYCETVSGWTEYGYIYSGQTMPLCDNGVSDDFNITISFERYYPYTGCDLANEGGWNDLIHTGVTSTTGSTIINEWPAEQLSSLWLEERWKRLGTLRIYHNGRPLQFESPPPTVRNLRILPIYHYKDFEEIILSDRGFQPFTHAVGGGVTGSGGIHDSVCCYSIKYAAYFEDPMNALYVRDRYLDYTKPTFNITECWEECVDNLSRFIVDAVLSDDVLYYLLTDDGYFYIKTGI